MTTIDEFKGRWRLKDNAEWLDGVLKFNPDEKSSLELFGSFDLNFLERKPKDIIYGETINGEIVTLVDSDYGGLRYSNVTNVKLSTYLPTYILIGKYFESLETITFTRATFQIFNLFQWLDTSGLDNKLLNGRYTINYVEPNPIEFDIRSNCKGCISFRSPVSFRNQKIEIEEYCEVSLSYSDVMEFKQVLKDIHIVNGFFTLNVFGQTYLTNLAFTDQESGNRVRCLFNTSLYSSRYKIKYQNELLLRYADIKGIFPDIIHNWYRLYNDDMSEVISLLLSLFRDMSLFNERKFLDAIKALEVFHRRFENNAKMDHQQYSDLLKEVNDSALSPVAKSTILEKMQYGNEPSLNKRIRQLSKKFSPPLLRDNLDGKFVESVVDTRNYLTHLDKSKEQSALKGKQLYFAFNNLKALLVSCILKRIGISDAIVEKALKNKNLVNSNWKDINA